MTKNNSVDDVYTRICKLGSGSYGTVYLAQRKQSMHFNLFQTIFKPNRPPESQFMAVKVYKKPDNNRQGIDFSCLREISCLQAVRHPNVVHCLEVLSKIRSQSPGAYQIAVVMDFHLQLSDLLRVHNSQMDRRRASKHILLGLAYLHENFIFHRVWIDLKQDLKPENIFVSRSGYAKIADFGFAKQFGTPYKKYTINACTLEYRAPEIFFGTHYYTEKADIWSLGCVFAFLFTGKPLFRADNKSEIQLLSEMFYLAGTPDEENWPNSSSFPVIFNFRHEKQKDFSQQLEIGRQIGDLIARCLCPDPRKRPSAAELLKDPFFLKVSDDPFDVTDIFDLKLKKLQQKKQ